jgi:hypothetical protein
MLARRPGSSVVIKLERFDYLALVALSALCIYLGTGGGQPLFHPDYVIARGILTIQQHGDPNFFSYPALVIYLNSAVYGLVYLLLRIQGNVTTPEDFRGLYTQGHFPLGPFDIAFTSPGVMITALFSVLGVMSTYLLALILTRSRLCAVYAGLILITSLLWAVETHYATVDIPLAALCVATVFITARNLSAPGPLSRTSLFQTGILFGVATSAKYNGALVFLAIAGVILLKYKHARWKGVRDAFYILVIGGLTFLLVNPFVLIRFDKFVADLGLEGLHQRNGSFGASADHVSIDHLSRNLGAGFGPLICLLAILGLIILTVSRKVPGLTKLPVIVFPVSYFLFMGFSAVNYRRYMVPIAPFVAIYAALALISVQQFMSRRNPGKKSAEVWSLIALLALVAPNLVSIHSHNKLLSGGDTRQSLSYAVPGIQAAHADIRIAGRPNHWNLPKSSLARISSPGREEDLSNFDIIVYDSIWHDDYVYQSQFLHLFPQNLAELYTIPRAFESGVVVQISPFITAKEGVPYSPDSNFSPYKPDLAYRFQSGPFIEIYCKNRNIADELMEQAKRSHAGVTSLPARDGFYFSKPYFRADPS